MVQRQKRSGGWDVREGSSADIASGLETDHAQVLAFVVAGEDDATRQRKFAMLRQVAVLMDDLLDVRRTEKWNAVVEALTPDLELSPTKLREAKMMSAARSTVLESGDFAPSIGHRRVRLIQCQEPQFSAKSLETGAADFRPHQ